MNLINFITYVNIHLLYCFKLFAMLFVGIPEALNLAWLLVVAMPCMLTGAVSPY